MVTCWPISRPHQQADRCVRWLGGKPRPLPGGDDSRGTGRHWRALPILVRLDAREYRIDGGITLADCVQTARLCEQAGADAIDVSAYGSVSHAIAFTEAPLVHEPGGFILCQRRRRAAGYPGDRRRPDRPEVAERHIGAGISTPGPAGDCWPIPSCPTSSLPAATSRYDPCIYCYLRQPDFHQPADVLRA